MRKKGRKRRVWLRVLTGLAALLLIFVAAAPSLASLGFVRKEIEQRLSDAVHRPVSIEAFDAGWTSGIEIRGLKILNTRIEHRFEAMVEVERASIDMSLTSLLFGDGPLDITVEGAIVRLEEEGGRTNFDDLHGALTKFRPPPPVPVEPVKRKPPRSLRLHLRNCALTLHRPAARKDTRPIDPARRDPVILNTGDRPALVGLEKIHLDVTVARGAITLKLEARTTVEGQRGSIKADIEADRHGFRGFVRVKKLHLAALGPLLRAELRGHLDLHVSGELRHGGAPDVLVDLEFENALLRTPGLPEFKEKWVRIEAEIVSDEHLIQVKHASLELASGRAGVKGGGVIPRHRGEQDAVLSLEGHGPLAIVSLLLGTERLEGEGSFRLLGRSKDGRNGHLEGFIQGKNIAFSGAKEAELPHSARVEFKGHVELDARSLRIDALTVDAASGTLRAKGTANFGVSPRIDVTADGALQFGTLYPMLSPLFGMPANASVAGDATLENVRVKLEAGGLSTVSGDAVIRGLRTEGFGDHPVEIPEARLHVDVTFDGARDTLRANAVDVNDLHLTGRAIQLSRTPRIEEITLKGSLPLDSFRVKAPGLELAGTLAMDLTAKSDGGILAVAGLLGATDLDVRHDSLPKGRLQHQKATLDCRLNIDRTQAERRITGEAVFVGDGIHADVKDLDLSEAVVSGKVSLRAASLDPIVRHLPEGTLPAGWTIAGDLDVSGAVSRVNGTWALTDGRLISKSATILNRGKGLDAQPLNLTGSGSFDGRAWTVERLDASARRSSTTLSIRTAVFAPGEIRATGIKTTTNFKILRPYLPDLPSQLELGTIQVGGDVSWGATLNLDLEVNATGFRMPLKKRAPLKSDKMKVQVNVELPFSLGGADRAPGKADHVQIHSSRFTTQYGSGAITGTIAQVSSRPLMDLRVHIDGHPPSLRALLPEIDALADFVTTFQIKEKDDKETGRIQTAVSGTVSPKQITIKGWNVEAHPLKFAVVLLRGGGKPIEERSRELTVSIGRMRKGLLDARNVRVILSTRLGEGGSVGEGTLHAERFDIGAVKLKGLSIDINGDVSKIFIDIDDVAAHGTAKLDELAFTGRTLRGATAKIEFVGPKLWLTHLAGELDGGRAQASGWLNVDTDPLDWEVLRLNIDKTKIRNHTPTDLRFVLPFLAGADSKLDGTLSAHLSAKGTGTNAAELEKTLTGSGAVEINDFTISTSRLLSLITLNLRGLAHVGSNRFESARVSFTFEDGRVEMPDGIHLKGPFTLGLVGSVGLDGTISFDIRGRPFRIRGSLDHPRLSLRIPKLNPFR